MPWFKRLIPLITLLLGLAAGYLIRDVLVLHEKRKTFVERREGGYRLINPLLDCDIAGNILRNEELRPFKKKVETALKARLEQAPGTQVSVYFRELNDGLWFSIGETEKFVPASLRKLPLMIALLKQAELAPESKLLDREVVFDLGRDYNADQNVKPSSVMVPGARYPVRELIARMIIASDNNAFTLLTKVVNSAELDRVYATLSMLDPQAITSDDFLSVQTYASFFRVLYNASYLSKENSHWALEVLLRSEFSAGLVSGVPAGVPVAHKFGEKSDAASGQVQLHDCGIVYYPERPYLLCVMSRGHGFSVLKEVIRDVSQMTFHEIDQQRHKK